MLQKLSKENKLERFWKMTFCVFLIITKLIKHHIEMLPVLFVFLIKNCKASIFSLNRN